MSPTKKLLNGPELINALTLTKEPVKWLDMEGSLLARISAEQAVAIARAGVYCGKASSSRVIYIREVDNRLHRVADFTYRDDRAVLQPYAYGHPLLGKLKDQIARMDAWACKPPDYMATSRLEVD